MRWGLASLTHEVPMVHLREATSEDVPVICEINVRGWRAAFRELFPDEFLDTMDPGDRRSAFAELVADRSDHRSAVVVDHGDVVGFVILGPPQAEELDPARARELWGLYIEPDRIGTGIGRILMDYALDYLRAGGWDYAILWTLRDIDRTCRFYEAAGWRRDGEERIWEIPEGNPVTLVRYRFDLH
jgi:GNAT superfamily N-acetyltransferase